ncbi:MAG: neutral zinc metallopeptidase [Bryobacteraceae bacterium]
MRWTPGGTSEDVEDRRGEGGGGGVRFGGIGGPNLGIGGTLLLVVLSFVFKTDLLSLFTGGGAAPVRSQPASEVRQDPREDRQVQFVSFVLDDAQRTWDRIAPQSGFSYRHAKLVLFRNVNQSACGMAESATGPFYCPADEKVYIDLSFFDELRQRFGAPGEFAQAYVIAHEIGHHVQKVTGTEAKVRRAQQSNPGARNQLSVRLELQADCYAGVWGNSTSERKIIDDSDVAAALRAASAIGDDRLQKMSTGRVSPDSFTHGSSAQRMQWFRRGLESGRPSDCNTFAER